MRGNGSAAVCIAVAAALMVSCVAPTGPGVGDVAPPGTHVEVWSVLPPGNGYPSGATSAHRDDQRLLYERLDDSVATGAIDDDDLGRFYKRSDIDLRAADVRRTDRPGPTVRVDWDRWGVPYVVGETSTDVAFGAGWATMEGRALVAELARTVGRRGGQELGVDDLFAAITPTRRIDYSDAELEGRVDALLAEDPVAGAEIVAELDAYVAGINRWIDTHPEHRTTLQLLGLPSDRWTRADVVASLFTVITGPSSGGEELANAAALDALTDRLGPLADDAYHDLRAADAPTTTHVSEHVEYPRFADGSGPDAPRDPDSFAVPDDPDALIAATTPATVKPGRSNVVAVSGARSESGHPLLVGGPQNGLTSPSLLFEMSLSGGGFRSRGVVMPGGGPYVFVGRSDDVAWTSTSGETDQVDTRAELLCEPDGSPPTTASRHYVVDGVCTSMFRPEGAMAETVHRSVHGPVIATGTVGGAPVAFTSQRAAANTELLASLAVRRLNRNEITTPEAFVDAIEHVTFSGHWFYADDTSIAYALAGRHPIRATGVTTELPSWGTGEWEWAGFMDPADNPSSIDPSDGCLHSWNNKVAPGWNTADDDWGNLGPHRVDLLVDTVCDRTDLRLADLVTAHTDAGSRDLRGAEVLPVVLRLLEGSPAPDPRTGAVRDVLADWVASGSYRRDVDRDLWFDHPGAGVVDAFFEPLVRAVFTPLLGETIDAVPLRIDAGARTTSSSFGYGWYGILTSDLERVMTGTDGGRRLPVACGGGDIERCRAAVWSALQHAAAVVAASQLPWNATDPHRWQTFVLPTGRIAFLPLVFDPVLMPWSNRPAFEQAVEFR